MMSISKLSQGQVPDALSIALQLVEVLGKTEMIVMPKAPTVELIQAIMLAGCVDEATAREIYKVLLTTAA